MKPVGRYAPSFSIVAPRRALALVLSIVSLACATQLHARCSVQISGYVAGISELNVSSTKDVGNCPTIVGYLVLQPAPSGALVDGRSYVVGQTVNGATVVADTTAGNFAIENGPYTVIKPGVTYAPPSYTLFGYDSSFNYSDNKSAWFSVTTLRGGGAQKNWSYKMPFASLAAPALSGDGEVVASGNDGILHAMSPVDGSRLYAPGIAAGGLGFIGGPVQSTSVVVSSSYLDPAVVAKFGTKCQSGSCEVAFLGSQDGTVSAFNIKTGQKLWQTPVLTNAGGAIVGAPVIQLRAFSSSAFRNAHTDHDVVIVGTHNSADATNNKVYGLRSDNGQVVWTFAPGNLDQINSTPAFDYGTDSVWITSLSNGNTQPSIWKLDTRTGQLIRSVTLATSNKDVGCSPVLNFNPSSPYIYTVTNGGDVIAVHTSSYSVKLGPNFGTGLVKYPFVLQNNAGTADEVYFSNSTSANKVTFTYATSTFSLNWQSTVAPSPSSPVPDRYPAPTAVYVGGSDGNLYKLNASDGTQAGIRNVNPGKYIGDANIDLQASKIYVGDSSGRIYSYDLF